MQPGSREISMKLGGSPLFPVGSEFRQKAVTGHGQSGLQMWVGS